MFRTIPAMLFAALSLMLSPARSSAHAAEGVFTLDARVALSGYQGVVEEHLAGVLSGLKALALTQNVKSGNWESMKAPLQMLSEGLHTDVHIWFAKPDGSYSTSTLGLTDKNLADREYFPELMAGKDVTDSLVISKTTGERSVIVATPVFVEGKVVGALGATVSVEKLAKLVSDRMRLPKDVVFYALDMQGRTALHTVTDLMFQYPSDIGDESLKSAVKTLLTEREGVTRYTFRGASRTAIFERSQSLGWVFVLGVTPGE